MVALLTTHKLRFALTTQRAISCMLFLFVVLVLLQIHGFSMAYWGHIMSDAESFEPLLGEARGIRSDDWMAQLPAAISQTLHQPAYPPVNEMIHPNGHEMIVGMNVPVYSWVSLFKPTTWGYYISPDFGISWHWQFRVFGLLLSAFMFFLVVMKASPWLALWGACCLALSSFFAYWAFISEPITGMGFYAIVLIYRQLTVERPKPWELALLFWTLVTFALNMLYPPFQIPMVYFVAAMTLWASYEQKCRTRHWPIRAWGRILTVMLLATATIGLHLRP